MPIRALQVVFFPSIENLTSYVAGNDSTKARMRQCFEADMVVSSANRTALGCPAIDYSLMIDLGGQAYGEFNQVYFEIANKYDIFNILIFF